MKRNQLVEKDKKETQYEWNEFWRFIYNQKYFFNFDELSTIFSCIDTVIFQQLNEKITMQNFCSILKELLSKFYYNKNNKVYEVTNNWKNSQLYDFSSYNENQITCLEYLVYVSHCYGFYLNDLLSSCDLLEQYKNNIFSWDASGLLYPPIFFQHNVTDLFIESKEIPCPYSEIDPPILQIDVYALSDDFDFTKTIKEIQEQIIIFRYHHKMKLSQQEYSVAKNFLLQNKITSFDTASNYQRTIGIILFDNGINGSPREIREFLDQHNLLFYKRKKCNISECKDCIDLDSCTRYLNEAKRITELCIKTRSVLSTKTKSNEIELPTITNYFYSNLKLYYEFLKKINLDNVEDEKRKIISLYNDFK